MGAKFQTLPDDGSEDGIHMNNFSSCLSDVLLNLSNDSLMDLFENHLWLQATAWHRAPARPLEFPQSVATTRHPFPPGCSLPYSNWDDKLQLGEQKIRQVASRCVPCSRRCTKVMTRVSTWIFYTSPQAPPMFSSLHICRCANRRALPPPALLLHFFPPCCMTSMLHDRLSSPPPMGFVTHAGLIIESEYFYRVDGSQNHKVTWNKSSLAISVSLITPCQVLRVGMRRRPGAVRVLVTRAQRSHFPGTAGLIN